MITLHVLEDRMTAAKVSEFLTGPNSFEQTWAPKEKELVEQAVLNSLNKESHRYWYLEENGSIVGAMGVRDNKYGSGGYEMDQDYMAVHKDYRNQGLASQLLDAVETFVKEHKGRYIHVLSCDINSYAPARAFYEKHGYTKVAEIPDYYVKGEGRIDYFKKI